jgi:hypothetical protein
MTSQLYPEIARESCALREVEGALRKMIEAMEVYSVG